MILRIKQALHYSYIKQQKTLPYPFLAPKMGYSTQTTVLARRKKTQQQNKTKKTNIVSYV